MRLIRNQPFCWAEKKVLRLIKSKYKKSELVKMKYLYFVLTEIDNDFNGQNIKFYTKTISAYSGLSKDWIPKGLKQLEKLRIISILEEKEKGKFKGKQLIFTPENIPTKTVQGKTVNGDILNGKSEPLEQSILSEEISLKEEKSFSPNQKDKEIEKKIDINFSFTEFWNKYDKKVGKIETLEKKWVAFSDKTRTLIMQHLELYIPATPDKQFRKHVSTYFNNSSWNDEIVQPKPKQERYVPEPPAPNYVN